MLNTIYEVLNEPVFDHLKVELSITEKNIFSNNECIE